MKGHMVASILDGFVLQPNFKHYYSHEFHQTNGFSLFHTNICSLNANFENLETLISNLEFSFSVIAVSETWTPIGKSEVKARKLESYQNYHRNRGSSIKSGCDFYVKEGIKFKPRKDLDIAYHDTDNEFQSTWIDILNGNKPNIIIGVYYRHPKKHSNNIFLENLKTTLHSLRNNNKVCLVAGDFNYDILKYEHNPIINEFLNLMYPNFFQPCILEPTRVVLNIWRSLIDNIYINTYNKTIHSGNFLVTVTDHMPNFCIIEEK